MPIQILKDDLKERGELWNRYVEESNLTTFFHQLGWKNLIERIVGYEPYYLIAEREKKVKGILPLFLTRSKIFGTALISLPFAVYGGICADDEETIGELFEEAKEILRQKKGRYLELRNLYPNNLGLIENDIHYTFIIELPEDSNILWEKLDRKARGAIRKGLKSEIEVEIGGDGLADFYNIFAHSLKNLGSFILSYKYFKRLQEEFKDKVIILLVRHKGKVIASVLTFLFKDTIIPYYGGCLKSAVPYSPNNLMYWKLMEYGIERGYKFFDFGKSKKGTGSYDFKVNFGFEPKPLHYQYYSEKIKGLPEPTNFGKLWYGLVKKTGKKLPEGVMKTIGHYIVRHLP